MNDHRVRNRIVSLAGLASQAPQVYQLLNRAPYLLDRVGLQRRQGRAARLGHNAVWFGAGIAVGTGLAALLTPNTGPETRRRLSERAHRVREYVAPKGDGSAHGQLQDRP